MKKKTKAKDDAFFIILNVIEFFSYNTFSSNLMSSHHYSYLLKNKNVLLVVIEFMDKKEAIRKLMNESQKYNKKSVIYEAKEATLCFNVL